MCGIIGYISRDKKLSLLEKASNIQLHRGPNAQSIKIYENDPWNIHFSHQRLSIIDLTDNANQPFEEDDYSLIYNGEIYNYIEIRDDLVKEGVNFKTHSDTEVVFRSIQFYGLKKAVNLFNGMWSFAFLNLKTEQLMLSRDRFGIKPLYYYIKENTFIFASEIKSILALSESKHSLNLQVIGLYIEQQLLESESKQTFWEDIYKIEPGYNCIINLKGKTLVTNFDRYYKMNLKTHTNCTEEVLAKNVEDELRKSIRLRLRSDVPVGVLLSGGVDSSSIASITHQESRNKTKLISYVSDHKDADETFFIDTMANYLNQSVLKIKIDIDPIQSLNLLKTVTYYNDQPLHSFSSVAHYLLMEKAKENNLTVILSGQGADEILCGYRKYIAFYLKYLLYCRKPFKALCYLFNFLFNGTLIPQISIKDGKRYLPRFLQGKNYSILTLNVKKHFKPVFLGFNKKEKFVERQIRDLFSLSVPSLLHYEDRMSMAQSREVRVPFLDHEVVESFLSLNNDYKLKKGWTKYILRKAMAPYLPTSIAWRRDKKGFTSPQEQWLKNELREVIHAIFKEKNSAIYRLNLINRDNLLKKYSTYCSNSKHLISDKEIFAPLALNIWLEGVIEHIKPQNT
ncbi:MAG: asparagine synthase (glutamine-hydrolyzing) [Bdellovibrionaceae bacterium]|nr:asparagine synthase (glutamine-hydrolyzing) [Pseudobdellovibrionaceae bacterium]